MTAPPLVKISKLSQSDVVTSLHSVALIVSMLSTGTPLAWTQGSRKSAPTLVLLKNGKRLFLTRVIQLSESVEGLARMQ